MITYQEIFKRFSKILGIPEFEARLSLEIFAQAISNKMELGDQLEIKSLGYFSLKKVQPEVEKSDDYQKIMIFSEQKISEQNKNILIFFPPNEANTGFPLIDSYLDLSFGKSLINTAKISDTEFSPPSTANEMISLIESKIEKIVSEAAIYKCNIETEQEFIPYQKEFNDVNKSEMDSETKVVIPEFENQYDFEIKNANIESKFPESIDDFELVESEIVETTKELNPENKEMPDWVFDDEALKKEIETHEENVEIRENLSISNDHKKIILKEAEIEHITNNQKKNLTLKMVYSVLTIILLAAASIAVYLNYDKIKDFFKNYTQDQSHLTESRESIIPNVISRSSEIQIASFDSAAYSMLSTTHDSVIISPAVFDLNLQPMSVSKSKITKDDNTSAKPAGNLSKVSDYIYKSDSEYIVQISSWRSKSKAESEMIKFKERGYPVYVEEYSSNELGTIYRVRVGGFKSISEVNNFLNQNK